MTPEQRLHAQGLPSSLAALRRRLAAAGLGHLTDDPAFRPAAGIALSPGKVVRRALPTGASRFGGEPDLPAEQAWPVGRARRPLAFLAQIRIRDLAGVSGASAACALPSAGRLWFFADTLRPPRGTAVDCAVIHGAGRGALRRRPVPLDGDGEPATDVLPELQLEFRAAWSLPQKPPKRLNEAEEQAYFQLAHPDGIVHQLLGSPDVIQKSPLRGGRKGQTEILILQLDSDRRLDLSFGDAGRLYILAPQVEAKQGDFRRCRAVVQSY